jgi:hypothetical protein
VLAAPDEDTGVVELDEQLFVRCEESAKGGGAQIRSRGVGRNQHRTLGCESVEMEQALTRCTKC